MTKNFDDMTCEGGPAFPTTVHPSSSDGAAMSGMTLRDWFAGQMLVGITQTKFGDSLPDQVAKWAYERADAMLAERAKP